MHALFFFVTLHVPTVNAFVCVLDLNTVQPTTYPTQIHNLLFRWVETLPSGYCVLDGPVVPHRLR